MGIMLNRSADIPKPKFALQMWQHLQTTIGDHIPFGEAIETWNDLSEKTLCK